MVIAASVGIGAQQVRGRLRPGIREGLAEFGKAMAQVFGMPFVEQKVHEKAWKAVEYGVQGLEWLEHRRKRWPSTANLHLLINSKTAVGPAE